MQVLVEIVASLVALLAAAVLSLFGLDADAPRFEMGRDVQRSPECASAPVVPPAKSKDC